MKKIILEKTGGVENLLYKEGDKITLNEQEVLVQVKAISVNPVDFKVRAIDELLTMICGPERPVTIGWDIAGRVVSVGSKTSEFKVGDMVFGMVNFPGCGNAYASYVAAPEAHLAKMPENTSVEDAAATTLAALTALQVLQNKVKKGDRVLIQAGSGGVGHFAIQIAKHLRAHVTTTSSAKNRDFVLSLGADEHIDYKTQAFEEVAKDMDFVLDAVGGNEMLLNSLKVVKEGGTIVSLPSGDFSSEVLAEAEKRKVDLSFYLVKSDGKDMNTLKKLLEKEKIKAHVSKTFPFAEMGEAHKQLESGRTVGKVVVTV